MTQNSYHLNLAFLNAWNNHDVAQLTELCAAEYEGVDVSQKQDQHGAEGICQMAARYWHAFPDLQFLEEGSVAEGDKLALFWTIQGTHRGELMKIPPTGKRVQVRGVSLLTLESGKIRRALYLWDVAGFLRALGLLPDL